MNKKLFFLYEFPLPKITGEGIVIVSLSDNVSEDLLKRKINFKTKSDYNLKYYMMPKEAYEIYNKIGRILVEGKSVRDILTYNGFCLWYFW